MTTSKPIYDLHSDDTEWLSKLSFYKNEIALMQKQIEEIASKSTSHDVLISVEHFQNQFLIQRGQLDNLKHKIKAHEAVLEIHSEAATEQRKLEDHAIIRDKMTLFEDLFSQLKGELASFVKK